MPIPGESEFDLARRGAMLRTIPRKGSRGTVSVLTSQVEKDLGQWRGQWVWLLMRTQDCTIATDVPGEAGVLTAHGQEGFILKAGVPEPFYVPQRGDFALYTFGAGTDTLDILGA